MARKRSGDETAFNNESTNSREYLPYTEHASNVCIWLDSVVRSIILK